MASLLPLLQDLLPMIMPSEVRVTRNHGLVPVAERAERPPWYQRAQRAAGQVPTSAPLRKNRDLGLDNDDHESVVSESDSGNAEPIRLFDHERRTADGSVSADTQRDTNGTSGASRGESASDRQHIDGPAVFRKDAMVGATDTMCATGKSRSIDLHISSRCIAFLVLYRLLILLPRTQHKPAWYQFRCRTVPKLFTFTPLWVPLAGDSIISPKKISYQLRIVYGCGN